jgi:hypothetical protein
MLRVLDAVFGTPTRQIVGGITIAAPTLKSQAMGQANAGGVLTIAIGNEAANRSLTCYVWNGKAAQWFKLGATPADHTLTFVPNAMGGFKIPENTLFYIAADVAVVNVWVDGIAYAGNPNP